jgi:cell division protease FtsH
MSFGPSHGRLAGAASGYRTVQFWVMMIALAAVLWQMASKSRPSPHAPKMSYSEFMDNVDRNNVASVKLVPSQSTADLQGMLRQPNQSFDVTIPKEVIPNLTETLRKQGVSIEVAAEPKEANWVTLMMTLAPIILILGFWIFMMRQMRARQSQSSGAPPASGPIGD